MTAIVMNTMGSLETMLRTLITGYAIALGKIKDTYVSSRTKQALLQLDDRTLQDIGFTRDQVTKGKF